MKLIESDICGDIRLMQINAEKSALNLFEWNLIGNSHTFYTAHKRLWYLKLIEQHKKYRDWIYPMRKMCAESLYLIIAANGILIKGGKGEGGAIRLAQWKQKQEWKESDGLYKRGNKEICINFIYAQSIA